MALEARGRLTWAQWEINLPWTGQTKCYNESGAEKSCTSTGQDGELQVGADWPNPRFTVSGECVTDNLTGLMWAKNANLPNGTRTWQGALDYVASINTGTGLCGYHDWRLPNINELESPVNAGEPNTGTWLNNQWFSNVQSNLYWSSTTFAYNPDYAWIVYMYDGLVQGYAKSNGYYVWPVRSGQSNGPDPSYPANIWKTGQTASYATGDDGDLQRGVVWPNPRFTDNGDGTIIDKLTGLMWTKNANLAGGTKTWQAALDYVKTLSTGAYSDWRLPNRKELFSLIDHSRYNPALPANPPFQNVQTDYYWSSTTVSYSTNDAWLVNMLHGYVTYPNKYWPYYVWPVRSGTGTMTQQQVTFGLSSPLPAGLGASNYVAVTYISGGQQQQVNLWVSPWPQVMADIGSTYTYVDYNVILTRF